MDYTIVTDVSNSNVTHPVIQTVADAKVDLVADTFVANYHRHKFVDFSFPLQGFENTAVLTKQNDIVVKRELNLKKQKKLRRRSAAS